MQHDFSDNLTKAGDVPALPAPPASARYNFEVPEHLTISDMLAIQLADCVRITQRLSDQVSDPHLHDSERTHTIHSLESVVNASETLTRTIGRLRNDDWEEESPRKRAKR